VERRRGRLEPEAGDDHREADDEHRVVAELTASRLANVAERERVRRAEDERRPEEQDR
jgi:hypothetical protein